LMQVRLKYSQIGRGRIYLWGHVPMWGGWMWLSGEEMAQ